MSLNRSTPDPASQGQLRQGSQKTTGPDYEELVKFLIKPFLELPDSLRVDCEVSPSRPRVLIRIAFEGSDKGRVFGRGGRNIQAIRTVVDAAAKSVGKTAYLEVYGSDSSGNRSEGSDYHSEQPDQHSRRSAPSKAAPKLRPQ